MSMTHDPRAALPPAGRSPDSSRLLIRVQSVGRTSTALPPPQWLLQSGARGGVAAERGAGMDRPNNTLLQALTPDALRSRI